MGLFSFIGSLLGLSTGTGGLQKINVLKDATSEGLPIIYGTRRVSPVNVFKIVSREDAPIPSSGHGFDDIKLYGSDDGSEKRQDEYKWLHRIGVWGQGEITGVEHFWVDGDSYRNRRFSSKPFFRAATKYGREFQSAITYLSGASGGKWGADQVGREIAYSWLRFFNSEDDPQYNADPRVEARLKGLKIWDPRSHPNDPDEKSYSANRALVLLDYLMADYGAGLRLNQIDIDTFIAAADVCDQGQTIPSRPVNQTSNPIIDWDYDGAREVSVAPGEPLVSMHAYQTSTSVPQYQCHAVIDPTQGVISNIKLLLKGMGWYMPWSNGKLKLIIEQAVDAPAIVFGEDDILGGWSITRGGRDNRLNRVTVDFPNANKDYENDTASWPAYNSDEHKALKAEDQGQDLHETVSLKTITNHYVAQVYAQYLVRKSRAAMRIDGLQLSPAALVLEPGDVIGLNESHQNFFYNVTDPDDPVQDSLKDTGRWFIVEKVSISPTLDVSVSLIDYDNKVYGLDDPDDEPLRTYDGNPNLLAKPPAVENLNADEHTETVTSGIVYSAAFVTWEKPELSSSALSEIILAWREMPETGEPGDFTQQMRLSPETTSAYISGLYDDRQYEIRVTYTTLLGRVSEPATYLLDLSAQEGTLKVFQEADEPDTAGLADGSVWINTTSGVLSVLKSGAWVEASTSTRVYSGSTAPDTPLEGDLWYDTGDGELKRYTGTQWVGVSATSNITVYDQSGEPDTGGLDDGSLWYETDTGFLWVLRNGNWVQTANTNNTYRRTNAPSGATIGDFWYDTNDRILYRYDGSDWDFVGNYVTQTSQLTDDAGLGTTALWTGIDGKSKIAFAVNENPNGSYHEAWMRFFGVDAATKQYPDRTEPAEFYDENGQLFTFGGDTNVGRSGLYAGLNNGWWLICLDTSGSRRFQHNNTAPTHVAIIERTLADSENIRWYNGLGGWKKLEFDSDIFIIGWCERRQNKFASAGMFDQPVTIFNIDRIAIPGLTESVADLPASVGAGVVAINPSAPLEGQYNSGSPRIHIKAFSVILNNNYSVSYNAKNISKSANTSWYVYVLDNDLNSGGSSYSTYETTSRTDVPEGGIYLGYVTVPGSGTSSGSGAGSGGGGGTFDPHYENP